MNSASVHWTLHNVNRLLAVLGWKKDRIVQYYTFFVCVNFMAGLHDQRSKIHFYVKKSKGG